MVASFLKRGKLLALACAAACAAAPAAAQKPAPARGGAAAKPAPAKTQPSPAAGTNAPPADPAAAPPAASPPPAAAADECGCEGRPLPPVLAVVGGVKLTPADFSPQTLENISQLRQQVIEARAGELNRQINNALLEAEAKKRGVTTEKLLEGEVVAKTVNPTEADARDFYYQNRLRVGGDFDSVRPQIVAHLREQRQQEQARRFADSLRAGHDVRLLAPAPAGPATDRARVLATVDGRPVTAGDVEEALRPLVADVQEQVYELRRQDLEQRINDLLLAQEAERRQVTPRQLLDAEVGSKTAVVGEAQALDFYNKNKARIGEDFAEVKYQIIQHLEDQQREKLEDDLAGRLRRAAGVQVFLAAPEPMAFRVATDDQPAKGAENAAVTIVEFTDYQCPSCAATHPVLERLIEEMGDRVRLVVRDFPLAQHEHAFKAAEAAEAAREQGKYWDFVAVLFRNQSALQPERLKEYASALGLDRTKFDAALDSGRFKEQVRRDMLDGQKLGVNATPTLFINGRRVREASYEGLKAAVESALGPARK